MTLKTMDSSIISFIILTFIWFSAYNRSERGFLQYRLFMALVATNMGMIVIDLLGWAFNGLPGMAFLRANEWTNLLLYITEPLAPVVWIFYTDFQVYKDERRLKRLLVPIGILWLLNAAFSFSSLWTGWFFYVDAQNIYHRGIYFWAHTSYCYLMLIYSFVFVLRHRGHLEKRYFYALLLFFLPQAIGTSIQSFHYGVSYNWSGMMLSVLILYFNIQDRSLNTDYLTGAYNRRMLDSLLKIKIRGSSSGRSFSAALIDLDAFKAINDLHGHDTGDNALKDAVTILKNGLRKKDFIARYGGDEFVIVMDLDTAEGLLAALERIKQAAEAFNDLSHRPYAIHFSMGWSIYPPDSGMSADDFLNHLDQLMYEEKHARRQAMISNGPGSASSTPNKKDMNHLHP